MIHDDTPANLGESEPPHIKNWFSSYKYESFVLETNDNFGFSDDQGSQVYENECSTGNALKPTKISRELVTNGENEGMLIKCNQSEEEKKCQSQVLESLGSPLLSPEPPAIENWFSSYVYESPEVDTIADLILSDHKESMVDSSEKISKKMKEFEKDEHLCVTPDDLTCMRTPEYDNDFLKTKETEKDENICISPDILIRKQTSKCDSGTLKTSVLEKDENLCNTPDDLICKQTSKCDDDSTKDDKCPAELHNDTTNLKSSEDESRKLGETGDGFVSIKSRKENDEKSKKVKGQDQKRCVVSYVNKTKKKSDERVTFGDVTNILEEHSSVTGKWKCPRKRKPDIGPPLKQLRLGQWFHQV